MYEQFGSLHLYDLKSGQTKEVAVTLAGDLPELRPHYVNVAKRLRNADISPNGARAVFEARGEIITVPAEKGDPRNLTNSPAVMEREPAWSPDGQSIAYFSDESGEYALHVRNQDGTGDVTKIALGKAFCSTPRWSPDSKKIAYLDNHNHLFYVDIAAKKPVLVETDYYANSTGLAAAWSPDSQWLAYSKTLKSYMQAIYLYSLAGAKNTQVTDGMSDAENPVFDKNGKYLYFTASTNSGAAMQQDVESFARPVTASVYVMVLAAAEASPLAPESNLPLLDRKELETSLQFSLDGVVAIVTYHPVTTERGTALEQAENLVKAIESSGIRAIFTKANADADGRVINMKVSEFCLSTPEKYRMFDSLGQVRYMSCLRHLDLMVGNSSSGLIEAPSFGLPVVNIGDRQKGRMRAANVFDVGNAVEDIRQGISWVLSPAFRKSLEGMENPHDKFRDGRLPVV